MFNQFRFYRGRGGQDLVKGGGGQYGRLPLLNETVLPIHLYFFFCRPSQFIVVESGEGQSLLHYDYLILCTGTQYQVPRLSIAKTKPSNVFTINNEHDTTSLLQWVKDTMPSNPKGIVRV